jgi:hypothetical protein
MKLLSLQISAEKYFFNIRKSLVEFDEVLEVCLLQFDFHTADWTESNALMLCLLILN